MSTKKPWQTAAWEFLSNHGGRKDQAFEGSHSIHTPKKLVDDILSRVNWATAERILVLFNPEFVVGLRELNISGSRITFYSDNEMKTEFVTEKVFGVTSVITSLDGIDMKFDLIIGNPPFQNPNRAKANAPKSTNLWSQFVSRSLGLLQDNGELAMITSGAWTSPSSKVFAELKEHNLWCVIENAERYFAKVNLHMTCMFVRKDKNYIGTKVIRENNEVQVDITKTPCFISDPIKASIVKKTLLSSGPRIGWKKDCRLHATGAKKKLFDTQSVDHPFPVMHTNKKTFFTAEIPEYGHRPKIWTTTSSYYQPSLETTPIAFTENCVFVEAPPDKPGLLSVLNSKLYEFLTNWISRPGGFMTMRVLEMIPGVDVSKTWTDSELYQHFGLTQEEIDYVEKMVE